MNTKSIHPSFLFFCIFLIILQICNAMAMTGHGNGAYFCEDNCDYSSSGTQNGCPVKETASPPSPSSLEPWTASDWNPVNEFTIDDPVNKGYIYNSVLALPGGPNKIFGSDYEEHIDLEEYVSGTSPGVPGPFPYSLPYSGWGGDESRLGKQFYGQILGHFGHTHILQVQQKVRALYLDPCTDTTAEDKMLIHLLNASTQIFNWYAQLVDNDGNFVDLSQEHPLVGQLKGLMGVMINGWNTPGNNGEIDINMLATAMSDFANTYNQGPAHLAVLNAELGRLQSTLVDLLDLDTSNPIPLLSWNVLMRVHQDDSVNSFFKYRNAYTVNTHRSAYPYLFAGANHHILNSMRMGRQLAAFFSAFYSLTNFLDKFYIPQLPGDEYAIPEADSQAKVDYIIAFQKRYWYEHTVIFQDWHKAHVLKDQETMYKIDVWFLESCANIATSVGEIFADFDKLVRHRGVYQAIAQIPVGP